MKIGGLMSKVISPNGADVSTVSDAASSPGKAVIPAAVSLIIFLRCDRASAEGLAKAVSGSLLSPAYAWQDGDRRYGISVAFYLNRGETVFNMKTYLSRVIDAAAAHLGVESHSFRLTSSGVGNDGQSTAGVTLSGIATIH